MNHQRALEIRELDAGEDSWVETATYWYQQIEAVFQRERSQHTRGRSSGQPTGVPAARPRSHGRVY